MNGTTTGHGSKIRVLAQADHDQLSSREQIGTAGVLVAAGFCDRHTGHCYVGDDLLVVEAHPVGKPCSTQGGKNDYVADLAAISRGRVATWFDTTDAYEASEALSEDEKRRVEGLSEFPYLVVSCYLDEGRENVFAYARPDENDVPPQLHEIYYVERPRQVTPTEDLLALVSEYEKAPTHVERHKWSERIAQFLIANRHLIRVSDRIGRER